MHVSVNHVGDAHTLVGGELQVGVDIARLWVHDRTPTHSAAAEYVGGTTRIEIIEGLEDHGSVLWPRLVYSPPTSSPVHHAFLHTVSLKAPLAKQFDRLNGHDTLRTAAVRDDFAILRQLRHVSLQLTDRHGARPWNVASSILQLRAHVE